MEEILRRSFQYWPVTFLASIGSLSIFAIWIAASPRAILFGNPIVPQQMVVVDSILLSFARIITGSAISFGLATLLSLALFLYSRVFAQWIMAVFFLIGVTPPPIWSTLSIMGFGLNSVTPIITILFSTLFLLSAVNINTLVRIPKNRLFIADVYGVSIRQRITLVIIPEAVPGFMLGMRLTLFVSWIALITAESSGVSRGLGSFLLFGRQMFDWQIVIPTWGAIISAAAMTDGVVSAIAKKALGGIGE